MWRPDRTLAQLAEDDPRALGEALAIMCCLFYYAWAGRPRPGTRDA